MQKRPPLDVEILALYEQQIYVHCKATFEKELPPQGWLASIRKALGRRSFAEFVEEAKQRSISNLVVGAMSSMDALGMGYVRPYVRSRDTNYSFKGKVNPGGDLPPGASGVPEFIEYVVNPSIDYAYDGWIPTLTRWSVYLKQEGFTVCFEDGKPARLEAFIKRYPIF